MTRRTSASPSHPTDAAAAHWRRGKDGRARRERKGQVEEELIIDIKSKSYFLIPPPPLSR